LSRQYPRLEERGQHDPIARRNKNKNKNSATTAAHVACAKIMTPRRILQSLSQCWQRKSLCIALQFLSSNCLCFCLREVQSTTNQTMAQGGGESYVMVDTCFFGLTKNEDKKKIGKFT
jgi:hypothetical protein